MDESKTPNWLLETQYKSWEPEILISGITLTFIFIISNLIYNFYGMLVQDYGIWAPVIKMMYNASIIIITGLKFILIFHLILRGIWTGLVGLSYVFPDGVKKENLPKMESKIDHDKPEKFVIQVEKICSLLFSFIFSTIMFMIATFIFAIPIVILFLLRLDMASIRMISLYIIIPAILFLLVFLVLLETRYKNSKIKQKMDSGPLNTMILIYVTNVGAGKTSLMYILYFGLILFLSTSEISKFHFKNHESADNPSDLSIVSLNRDHYESMRDQTLRIPKATITEFRNKDNSLELFLSYYHEDTYTIKTFENNSNLAEKFDIKSGSENVSLSELYSITVDSMTVSGLKWYRTKNKDTNQEGLITSIPLDNLEMGYHELTIDKVYWSIKKEEMIRVEDWDIIPFEIMNKP